MSHPELIGRTCEKCQKWLYRGDSKKGMGSVIATKNGKPQKRHKGIPTPCRICPKEGPEHAKKYELSLKNLKTLRYYFEVKGSSGACLELPIDPILQKNLGILESNFMMHKDDSVSAMMMSMIPFMGGKR